MTLRPLQAADVPELTRIIETPAVARWWDDGAPWEEPDATMLTIVAEGRIAGLIQYTEELDRKYRHASIDIFVDPVLHGRGIGTEAIRQLARHLSRTAATTGSRSTRPPTTTRRSAPMRRPASRQSA